MKIASHQWLPGTNDEITTLDTRNSNFDEVSFAGKCLPMVSFFESLAKSGSSTRFIFFDSWKVYEAYLFNPVVLLVVFGHGPTLKQYVECVKSLSGPLNNRGRILILSNVAEDDLLRLAPGELRPRIEVLPLKESDFLDYVSTRIKVFDTVYSR